MGLKSNQIEHLSSFYQHTPPRKVGFLPAPIKVINKPSGPLSSALKYVAQLTFDCMADNRSSVSVNLKKHKSRSIVRIYEYRDI